MGKIYDITVNILTIEKRVETGFHSLLQCIFPIKNSPHCTSLEQFAEKLYANMRDVHSAKIINLIEHYKNIA